MVLHGVQGEYEARSGFGSIAHLQAQNGVNGGTFRLVMLINDCDFMYLVIMTMDLFSRHKP